MSEHDAGLKENNTNWFVRLLIIGLSIFIVFLIFYNYIYSLPKGEINSGIVILLSFLIILSLSESFNNFSVGKIFSLERTVREKKSDISQLKTENAELRSQIVKVSTSISQGQMSNTFLNFSEFLSHVWKVKPADKEEIEEKEEIEDEIAQNKQKNATQRVDSIRYASRERIDRNAVEDFALNKYIEDFKFNQYNLIREAKLSMDLYNVDPISTYSPLFDGYIKTQESDIFIEVKMTPRSAIFIKERIYLMLNKILYYRNTKKINSFLVLILVNPKDEDETIRGRGYEDLKRYFEPAITSGLLKIINYTWDEFESSEFYKDRNSV